MKNARLALLGAALLLAGQAFAGEHANRNSECIVRPGYWGYEPLYCNQGSTPAPERFKAERARPENSSRD